MHLLSLVALLLLVVQPAAVQKKTGSVFDGFSDLINTNVKVVVDPLRIIYSDLSPSTSLPNDTLRKDNSSMPSQALPSCVLSIHRNECSGPRILRTSKIAWDTRICFKWECENATKFAMKVENCWTGSIQNPIFIINANGCTNEETMISSPKYQPLEQTATAIGWLSVRLVGSEYIRLACAVRLCNLCDDPLCSLSTPPECPEQAKHSGSNGDAFKWDEAHLNATCNTPASTSLPIDQSKSSQPEHISAFSWVVYLFLQLLFYHLVAV